MLRLGRIMKRILQLIGFFLVASLLVVRYSDEDLDPDPLSRMKRNIMRKNDAQEIRNSLSSENAARGEFRLVIVVQVHNRIQYLKQLLESLKRSTYIAETLVILSHDYFSEEINDLVLEQTSFPLMQIFYPNSIQVYPDTFPGSDPNDCPRDLPRNVARTKKCNNAETPDQYGHYREANITQTKHHWIWKLHRVFDELRAMKNYNGPVLLVEEDHYVVQDFVHVTEKLTKSWNRMCSYCNIATIGNYKNTKFMTDITNQVEITNWVSSQHNMGMVVNRKFWKELSACLSEFCHYDDYNWDWTLQQVGGSCLNGGRFACLALESPRVFHIGECGLHHKGGLCQPDERVSDIERVINRSKSSLFPNDLVVKRVANIRKQLVHANGGWGDIRDHDLCMRNAGQNTKQTSKPN